MEHEIHSRIKIVHVVAPQALNANTNGAAVDTKGYESLEYVLHVGTAFVGGGFTTSFQESDTGAFAGEETAVPADNILSSNPVVSIGDANMVFRVGIIGKMRYQRPVLTETGTISAGVIGVSAILSHPQEAPVADQYT